MWGFAIGQEQEGTLGDADDPLCHDLGADSWMCSICDKSIKLYTDSVCILFCAYILFTVMKSITFLLTKRKE